MHEWNPWLDEWMNEWVSEWMNEWKKGLWNEMKMKRNDMNMNMNMKPSKWWVNDCKYMIWTAVEETNMKAILAVKNIT